MRASKQNIDLIRRVAIALRTLRKQVVFVGGAIVGLLLDDEAAEISRPTDDVDLVIEVASTVQYQTTLRNQLIALGFTEDHAQGAPLCRWLLDGIKVDVMPTKPEVLGLNSRWFDQVAKQAQSFSLPNGPDIRLVTVPCFLATKLEAFSDRGKGDYEASVDVEDIVTVVDGRLRILDEIDTADPKLRAYIETALREMLSSQRFIDSLPGHLGFRRTRQNRLRALVDRLQQLAGR